MASITKPTLTFFDLPAEIRNEIYMHSLVDADAISLPYAYEHVRFHEPALLSAHPIILREAAPIFYGCNTFSPPSPAAANAFLLQLSPRKIGWIRHFRSSDLVLSVTAEERWFEALRGNLNKILDGAKGVLAVEALRIPIKQTNGIVKWCGVEEVEGFEAVKSENGGWRVEWKKS